MNDRTNLIGLLPVQRPRLLWGAASALGARCEDKWEVHVRPADEPLATAVARIRPDALCLQVHPNDMRAQEALKLVRVKHPDLPILIVSEAASEALALTALRLRVWDLLVHPLAAEQLDDALARLAHALPRTVRDEVFPRRVTRSRRRSTYPATRFIRDNLHHHLSLADCARICNLSRCEFSRRFHAEHGVGFSEYVLRLRIQRAAVLLAEPRYSVSEAAFAVGFNDLSYFARVFRRFVGMPASLYRQSLALPA